MKQEELIIDYTEETNEPKNLYHQLLYTVILSNIADIILRYSVYELGAIISNLFKVSYASYAPYVIIITQFILSVIAVTLLVISTIWVFKVISQMVGKSPLLTITLSVTLTAIVLQFLLNISGVILPYFIVNVISSSTADDNLYEKIRTLSYISSFINIGGGILYNILSIVGIILKLFVLIQKKALHKLLIAALIIPGIIYLFSIPGQFVSNIIIEMLANRSHELSDVTFIAVVQSIAKICRISISELVAIVVDLLYLIYLGFAMKKTKEVDFVGDGIGYGFAWYIASTILTLIFIVIILVFLTFI